MGIPKDILRDTPALGEWAIISTYRGSIAHNMYVPQNKPDSIDDKDTMTVCIPPLEYYFGLSEFGSRGTQEIKKGEWDIVVYELKKFIRLLEQGNPNVLSLLWCNDRHILHITEEGKLLRANKNLFVGRHAFHSFSGYAKGQLHRMTHMAFEGYMGAKRKGLVEKFGYDTKNAAHLIRILRMGIEFMNEGVLYVERSDNQELLEIKRGEWGLERVKEEADRLFKRAEDAYDRCKLPDRPDHAAVEKLCMDILRMRFLTT